jgi:hypothetical protein
MCRLVVWAKGNTPGYQKGDVIAVVADGVFLGRDIERGHPGDGTSWWRIIELPGVSVNDATVQALLYRDPGDSDTPFTTKLGLKTPKRQRKVDITTLETLGGVKSVGDKITTNTTVVGTSTITKAATATTTVIG